MKIILIIVTLLLTGCESFHGILFETDKSSIEFLAKSDAFIYENKETGELLYCSNKQDDDLRDFEYKGIAIVTTKDIVLCELE